MTDLRGEYFEATRPMKGYNRDGDLVSERPGYTGTYTEYLLEKILEVLNASQRK